MNYKIILSMLLFTIVFSNIVFATPPSPPPCYEVENPEHYKNLVYTSEIYNYFQDWELKNITVPCHYERGSINVILKYNVPTSYSTNNLNYQTTVIFSFKDNQLINSEELNQVFKNYKQHIENFESEENIRLLIQTTGATNVKHEETRVFKLESQPREYVNYDFIDKSIVSLSFANPILIDKIEKFVPKISDVPQVTEFRNNVGIHFIEFGNNRLSIHEEFSCPTCESYFIYDLSQLFPTSYSLDNNFEWKTFPEISKAHKTIEENLLIGELSNCSIGTGDMHTYTIVNYHNSPTDSWFMTVALKCDGGTRWKDASIRLNPNGTHDRLEIKMDYHPKTQSRPISSNSIILTSIIILIILAIVALIIKLRKMTTAPPRL